VKSVHCILAIAILVAPCCGSTPVTALPDVIVTAAPAYSPLAALKGKERFPQGAQLMRIHMGKAQPLVPGFFASADAQISFDGKSVLFAAKPSASDHWQIWELPLASGTPRRLIAGSNDVIRPFYLPAGQFVYAQHTTSGFALVVGGTTAIDSMARIDDTAGNTTTQISHLPGSVIPADVLHDGRILFESFYPLGSGSTPELYLVYTDGSGVESYRCDHGRARWGGHQLASDDVVFTHGSSLARFTSPQAHEITIAAPHAEYSGSPVEMPGGDWLLSARASATMHFSLHLMKPDSSAAFRTVLTLKGLDLVEPVVVAPRLRPNHHPSALHAWNYANQLALDARISRNGNLMRMPARVQLETLEDNGHVTVTGTAPIESDGSFFVQTPADRAIRFILLDSRGQVLRRQNGWFWIRGGEQRICVGCHAGPERAAENRVPAVLLKSTTPVNLTGISTASQPKAGTQGGK
jgi:hypothetical protein